MKKYFLVLLSLFMVLSVTGCSSNKSMLRKMNITDLPTIVDANFVKKSKNFVSQATMYLGEQDTFDTYAMSVYEYLVDNYYDSLGYSSEILQSFFGTSAIHDFNNQTILIDQFKAETKYKITYQFIFSNNNSFWLNETDNTYYLKGASSIVIIYYKDYQENDKEKMKYNIAVELYKPLSNNNYAHVNSGIFSSFIFKNTSNLKTKGFLINIFLEEFDLTILSKEEVIELLGTEIIEDDNIQYKFIETNSEFIEDKTLKIYYEYDMFLKYEIVNNGINAEGA